MNAFLIFSYPHQNLTASKPFCYKPKKRNREVSRLKIRRGAKYFLKKGKKKFNVMAHTYHPSTWKTEMDISVECKDLRSAWAKHNKIQAQIK